MGLVQNLYHNIFAKLFNFLHTDINFDFSWFWLIKMSDRYISKDFVNRCKYCHYRISISGGVYTRKYLHFSSNFHSRELFTFHYFPLHSKCKMLAGFLECNWSKVGSHSIPKVLLGVVFLLRLTFDGKTAMLISQNVLLPEKKKQLLMWKKILTRFWINSYCR